MNFNSSLNSQIKSDVEAYFDKIVTSPEKALQTEFDKLFRALPTLYTANKHLWVAHSHLIRLIKAHSQKAETNFLTPTGYLTYRSESLNLKDTDFSKIDLVARFIKVVLYRDDFSSIFDSFQLSVGLFLFNLILFSRILSKKHLNAINLDLNHTYSGSFGIYTNIKYWSKYTNISDDSIEDRYYQTPFSYALLKHISEQFSNVKYKKADYSNCFRKLSNKLEFSDVTLDVFIKYSAKSFKLLEGINISEYLDSSLRQHHRLVPLSHDYYKQIGKNISHKYCEPIVCFSKKSKRRDESMKNDSYKSI